ncbi:unnamed protein product [Mycena citricolor]|uniref:OPT oligopeptide transporter n=1 Tax=Mycena citricolor TaxID=2018698 RepID=A0AAD2HTM9_9AGAR|nr:unnamed protein product [Mycena citricolor]
MEDDLKPYMRSNDELPQYIRRRTVSDAPEEDEYMDRLNDPNIEIKRPLAHPISSESFRGPKEGYAVSEDGAESSDRYSAPSRAGSRDSTAIEFDDESPYPEVRAAVSSVDDPSMPVNTFRMWFLGIVFSILFAGTNQVFDLRSPAVFISNIVGQLISLPAGMALAFILPTKTFKTFGLRSLQEHVCITTMINVAYIGCYGSDVLLTQKMFYSQNIPWSYQLLLLLGTQAFGFSLGGILRRFVVWPASMIWPSALVSSALFNTLHKNFGKRDRGHMTRERFFFLVAAGSFVWYWVPGYLFAALSVFNWVCWIAPNNVTVNALFGASSGMGMSVITFDWAMISFIGSPLITPWWSQFNTLAAVGLVFWMVVPIMYFTNTLYTAYLPISAYNSFDNTGMPYNISAVIDGTTGLFDATLYAQYSPIFMTAALCMAYFMAFASFGAIFTHTFLWFGRDIVRRFHSTLKDEKDVHSRLMQSYAEVPGWWYLAIGVISTVFIFVAVEIFPTELPIWAVVVALAFAIVTVVPLAMIQAITNQSLAMQVVAEMIAGFALPGRPVANIIFKTIAYNGTAQGIVFAGDQKLGHYMKIPPRTMFAIQTVSCVLTVFVTSGVQNWLISHVAGICTGAAVNGFTCPSTTVFATASITWGGIGPHRLFGTSGMYNSLLYGLLFGFLAPIPFYLLARRYPLSFWRYINMPVFCGGVAAIPAASAYNYAAWGLTGFIFNYVIRRRSFRWWMRYNYSASVRRSGLWARHVRHRDLLRAAVLRHGPVLNWWGNTVSFNNADGLGTPLRLPDPSTGVFGPASWS